MLLSKRLVIANFFFLLLVFGCARETTNRLNCICLIDFSGSLSQKTLQNYVKIISYNIMMNLGEHDRLIVMPIDEGSKTEAVKIIYEDMSDHKFSFPTDGFTHARERTLKRIREYVKLKAPDIEREIIRQKELRKRFTYYTDIVSALEQAAELMERPKEESFLKSIGLFVSGKKKIIPENMIVFLSDMIHESTDFTFANRNGPTPEQTESILNSLRLRNKIPNLRGCKVFVNGRTGYSTQQVENIQNFWNQFFREAQAKLMVYTYDAGNEITSYLSQRHK